MKYKYITKMIVCCVCWWAFASWAGYITIQKRSEMSDTTPDPWQIKQQILAENQWREWLKTEQGINLLYQLPIGCALFDLPQPRYGQLPVYNCFGRFYRPYTWQNQDVFVEVVPPQPAPDSSLPHSKSQREKGSNKP